MKNLVKIKDTFFCGVRHCGKAMLLLVALTALSSSAWAEVGFWTESAANVHIKGWDDPVYSGGLSSSGVAIKTIEGYYSSLVFNDIWVKVWQDRSQDYMTKVQFRYWIDGKDEKNIDLSAGDWSDSNQTWYKNTEVTIYDGSKAGNHKLTFLFNGKPSYGGDCWLSNNSQNYEIDFTVPGWSTTSGNAAIGTATVGSSVSKTDISLGTHYGDSDGCTTDVGGTNASDFSVTAVTASKITVKFTPSAQGSRTATITITDKYGKTRTLTVTGTGNNVPTVLISKRENVNLQEVSLYGYVKYTGCKNIEKVGFIASQDPDEVENGSAQVYEATSISTNPIEATTNFTRTSDEFENETYYYRAWMKASDGTIALSAETRTFEPQGVCTATSAGAILPIFKSGKTTESATFIESSASIDLTVEKESIADVYQWNTASKPDGSTVTFTAQDKRNTNIEVDKVGTYTFTLSAKCTDGTQLIESSRVLTLYVCEPAETTQLYLDNHTDNVLCVGEKATATCQTKEGYTYSLYSPSGDNLGSLGGDGRTQKWRNVEGAGVFTMRTSPTSMPECAAVVSSATQSYNEPTLEITADPGFSVIDYQPVTLSKKNVTSDTYVDTNPTWVITDGADKGYLLNEHNRLAYDNRAREKVVFKGGAAEASQVTVQASAYKTVAVEDEGGNYTKQCPTTVEVKLTVSPAVDDCD